MTPIQIEYSPIKDKDSRDLLGTAKFLEGYSRYDESLGRYENWSEAVQRVMNMHKTFYKEKIAENPKLLEYMNYAEGLYKAKRVLGSQRSLQFGGDQILKHHMKMFNCFGKETRFITSEGIKAFSDFSENDEICVLTHKGNWKSAIVKSYGEQELQQISFRKNTSIYNRTIRATATHRWILANGSETTALKVDDRIYKEPMIFGDFDYETAEWKVSEISTKTIKENVWCLEVEDDNSFILEGGIVTGNCVSGHSTSPKFFGGFFYILLCGSGAGFSVQKQHVAKMPMIRPRTKQPKTHTIEDSIEGWATALDVLMSSYFIGGGVHPEYEGRRVFFEFHKIRKKGSPISGGFKAPGPEPLKNALNLIEDLLTSIAEDGVLRPIHIYDICMHTSDAVLSGGVRRAATICMFSKDDDEMLKAKTGDWFVTNPQRARSNNSVMLKRDEITLEEFESLMESVKEYGEPGFIFVDDYNFAFNPCVEISFYPITESGVHGWQGCNLSELNGAKCTSEESFLEACKAGTILGTLQAGYTDFKFLGPETKELFDKESLLGVSVTGWMNSPNILFDEDILRKGARVVKRINEEVAKLLGINKAARTTCAKPAGNASVLLGTASGISAEHSKRYIRNIQMNKTEEIAEIIKTANPYMVEESVWNKQKLDYVISFPIVPTKGSITKGDISGVEFLEKVKLVQNSWVEEGTNVELCTHPKLRHNVSNTVTVGENEWPEVTKYIFDNRQFFAGISLISATGDKDYFQAPFTEVLAAKDIVKKYGEAALFASGLIVDSTKGFNNLWEATDIVQQKTDESSQELKDIRSEWIRRFIKFSDTYFEGDLKKTSYCLKDVYNLYRWMKIQINFIDMDLEDKLKTQKLIDIDTMGALACAGVAGCEI